jgi:hypothetical protein
MSYPPNGSYKSKILSFINRHSQKLGDRLTVTVRHLKVAIEWSLQIMLYPVYLLVQTGRIAKYQLEQKLEQAQLPTSAIELEFEEEPAADESLREVLNAIAPWLSSPNVIPQFLSPLKETSFVGVDEGLSNSRRQTSMSASAMVIEEAIASNNLVIQGIATLLDNRVTVLVTEENQLLNILTKQQQQELKRLIEQQIIQYRRNLQRLGQLETNQFKGLLPEIEGNNGLALLPLKLFWNLMNWVQSSPVAIAVDIFGESNLLHSATYKSYSTYPKTTSSNNQSVKVVTNLPNIKEKLNTDRISAPSISENQIPISDFVTEPEIKTVIPEVETVDIVEPMSEPTRIRVLRKELQEKLNSSKSSNDNFVESDLPAPLQQAQNLINSAINFVIDKSQEQLNRINNDDNSSNNSSIVHLRKPEGNIFKVRNYTSSVFTPAARLTESLTESLGEGIQKLQQNLKDRWHEVQESIASVDDSESNGFQLKSAIQGAVKYIDRQTKKRFQINSSNQTKGFLSSSKQEENVNFPQEQGSVNRSNWSFWNDPVTDRTSDELNEEDRENNSVVSEIFSKIQDGLQATAKLGDSLLENVKGYISNTRQTDVKSLPYFQPQEPDLDSYQHYSAPLDDSLLENSLEDPSTLEQYVSEDEVYASKPEWLETEATSMGYVKHPLERVLGLLDQIIVWIEELIVRIWGWIRELVKKIKDRN